MSPLLSSQGAPSRVRGTSAQARVRSTSDGAPQTREESVHTVQKTFALACGLEGREALRGLGAGGNWQLDWLVAGAWGWGTGTGTHWGQTGASFLSP